MRTEEQVKGHGVNKSMLTEQVSVMEEVLMRSVRSEEEVLLRGVRSDVCEDLAVMEVAKSWKKFMKSLLTTLAQVCIMYVTIRVTIYIAVLVLGSTYMIYMYHLCVG